MFKSKSKKKKKDKQKPELRKACIFLGAVQMAPGRFLHSSGRSILFLILHTCIFLTNLFQSLSLSLSNTHTHTHVRAYTAEHRRNLAATNTAVQQVLEKGNREYDS